MSHRGHIGKVVLRTGIALLGLLLPVWLQAQTSVHLSNTAGTGTFNLSSISTWNPAGVPTNGNNVFIVFTGNNFSGNTATFTNAPSNVFVADSLTITNASTGFNGGTLSVTFSGMAYFTSGVAQVNFAGGGNADATNTKLTFSSNVTFGAMNFIGNTGGNSSDTATLTLAGTSQGNTLLFTAGGTENNLLIVSGALGLTSTLTVSNINSTSAGTISGNSTVGNVFINTAADNRFTITNSTMSITGAVASVAGGFTLANNATITLSGGGGLVISNVAPVINGTLNVVGQTVTGKTNWSNNGTVALAGGYIVGNNLTNSSGATLLGYGNLSNVVVNLGTIWATNNTLAFASNIVQGGTVTIGSGSTLSLLGSGALTNSGTINLVGAAGVGNNAILNLGTVALTNLAGGTITGGGIIQNASQVVNLLGGSIIATSTVVELQFTNGNTFGNAGTIGATAGATLTFGTDSGTAMITNFGTINLTGGTLDSGAITNLTTGFLGGNGTVTAPAVVNSGIVSATNGELVLQGVATGAGAYRAVAGGLGGTLTFAGGGSISALFNTNATIQLESTLTNNSVFVNQGTMVLNAGTYQSSANFTNAANEFVIASDDSTLNAANVVNRGTILTTNATLLVSNLVVQGGTVTIGNGGTLMLVGAGALTNFGTINLVGAMGNNAVLNLGSAALTNLSGATITGGGIIQNASQVVNLGTILATNTAVELQFTNGNTFGNAGTIGATAGATLTFGTDPGSAIITNFGTINLTGGALDSGAITNLGTGFVGGFGTISSNVINGGLVMATNGTLTLASTLVNNATAIVANASALTVSNDWTNGGVLSNAVTGTVNGGNLTNTGTINGSGFYNSQVINQNRLNFGGTISNNFLQTAGSFTVSSGGSTITGSATVNGGTLDLTGNRLTAGQLVIASTGVLSNSVLGATLNGSISNAATVNFSADAYITGTVTNTGFWLQRGAISNSVVNSGTMLVLSNNIAARITGGIVNSGSLTFTNVFVSGSVNNSGSFSMSGAISNNYVQTGGSLTLANTSTITGTASITAGNFDLNGKTYTNGLMVVSGTGVLTSSVANATFNGGLSNAATVYLSQSVTFNGPVTNAAAFSWLGTINNTYAQGAGTNQLLGNGTITGNVSLNGGVMDLNGTNGAFGALTGGGGTILNNGAATGTLTIGANNSSATYSGTITNGNGTLALVKTGTGTEALTGVNGYSGGTTINGGTLVAGSSTALGSGGLAMTGGTLQLLANLSIANLSGTAGTIGIFSNNLSETLTVGSDNSSTAFSGVIGQGGNANTLLALTKIGSGNLTLTGNNTYSGGTTIDGGVLVANTLPNAGSTSSSIGTGSLTLNGGALRYNGVSLGTANFSTTVGANGGTLDAVSSIFYNGTLFGSGTLNILDSSGGGNAWLFTSASPSFSGPIDIGNGSANSGWLQVRGVTSANQVGTGTVTINGGGTFSYDQGSAATIANPIVLNGGALGAQSVTITYSGPIAISNNSFIGGVQAGVGTTMTLSGVISGPGGFATAGDNGNTTLILTGTNTYGGNTTINSGTVELNNSLAVQNSTVNDLLNNALTFGTPTAYTLGGLAGTGNIGLGSIALSVGNNNSNTAYSGILSGSGSLTKIGTGVLTLSGANTYSGATTISGGTLKLGASNVIPDGAGAGNVTDNGTLDMGGFSDTINGLSGNGTVDNSGVGASTLTVGNNNTSSSFSGVVQNTGGALSLTKTGTGVLTLSGNNTFSGVLTVQAGTLSVATVNDTGAAGPLGESANAVVLGGSSTLGTLEYTGGTAASGKMFAIGAAGDNSALGGVIQVDNSGTALTLSGEVYQVSQGLLTKTGAGTLVLAGTQDNVGLGVIVDSGTLVLAKTSNSGVHAIGGAGFTLAGGTVQLGGTGGQQIYSNSVDITVNSGTFDFNGNSTMMGGLAGTGGTILNNGGGASTITFGFNNDSPTYSGTITDHSAGNGTMALVKVGTGTETLGGSNSYSGGTTISGGTLKLGNANALGTGGLDMNGGTLNLNLYSISIADLSGSSGTILANNGGTAGTYTLTVGSDNTSTTYGGMIANNTDGFGEKVALTKTGTGVLTLSGNSSYNGATTIGSGGAINIQSANALGTSAVTVNSGGALQIQGGITAGQALTLNGTGLSNDGALENVSGNNTYAGGITLGSATRIDSDSGTLTLSSFTSGGNFALTIGGAGNVSLTAALPATVNSLTKDGTGTLILANTGDAYVGATTISAGTLKLGANNVIPDGAGKGDVTDNGTLDMAGFSDTINGLNGSGTVDNSTGTGNTLTVGGNNANSTFSGVIQNTSGSLGLAKAGTGVLTLSGSSANTYSGLTTVNAGEVDLNKTAGVNAIGGNLTVAGGEVKLLANEQIANGAVVTVNSGSFNLNGATETVGNMIIGSGGLLTNGIAGGTLNNGITNAGAVFVSQSTFFNGPVTNTGAMFFQGAISNNLVNAGAGTITLNNTATITGTAAIDGGTLNLNGQTMTNGLLIVDGGTGVLTNAVAGATVNGGISNAATISVTANTFFNGPVTNTGAMFFQGAISNNLVSSAGAVTLNGNATITQNATVSGGTFNLNGKTYTNGLMVVSGTGVLTNGQANATFNGGLSNAATVALTQNTFFNGPVTNTGTFLWQGAISNTFVSSGGAVTLNGNATITQNATVSGGTFNLNGQTYSNNLMVVSGAGVLANSAANATFNGGLSNAATVSFTQNVYVNGPVTNTGAMFFQGAISNSLANSGSFNLNNNATLTVAPANSGTINVAASTLTVNPAWANPGTILIGGGTVAGGNLTNNSGATISGAGTIAPLLVNNGLLTVTNGTLTLSIAPQQNGLVNVADGGAPGTLSVTPAWNNNGTVSIASGGAVTGGNFTNLSSGTVTNLGAINTLLVNQGSVVLGGSVSNFQQAKGTNVISGRGTVTGTATISGGLFDLNGGTYSNGLMVLGGTGVLTSSVANATFNGGLSNAATVYLSQGVTFNGPVTSMATFTWQGAINNTYVQGAGTNLLTGNATITGGVTVNGGVVNLNGYNETTDGLNGNGGTIDNNGGGASTLTIGMNNGGGTYSGVITNGTGTIALVKNGTGSETLSGNNGYTGGTTINSGTILAGSSTPLGTGNVVVNGTFDVGSQSPTIGGLSGSGSINMSGESGNETLIVGGNNAGGTFSGIISDSSSDYQLGLTKVGTGTEVLSGNNVYYGATTVSGGALQLASSTALGNTAYLGGVTVSNGAALQLSNNITISGGTYGSPALTLNGTGISNGGALENVSGNNTYGGAITLGSATRINSDSGLLTLSSFGSGGNFALTIGGAGNTLITAALPGTVNSLTKDGTGVLTLSGANAYVGATTISAGTLKLGANNVIPDAPTSAGNVTDNGTLDMGGFSDAINGLSGSGTVDNSGGGTSTLTVGNNNATSVFAGTIQNTSGTLALAKTGTGVLTLSGTNTYGGATTVSQGVLQLGSSGGLSSNSAVSVSSGGTLDLNGQAGTARTVTISSGGGLTNGVAGASLNNGLTNAGTVFVSANTFFNGPVTNTGAMFFQGAISNALINSGSFNLNNNATLTVAPVNKGTINVAASTLTVNPDWANPGTVQLGGGVLTGGNLTNNSGASVAGFGTVSNQLVNAGVVTATNGNLNLVGAANGSGTYRAVAGTLASTLTFVNGGSISSLFDTGATIQVEGALTNTSSFVNEGTLMVAGGTYQSAANLTNAIGALIANSGAGSINAAAVVNLGTILATNATFVISNFVAQGGTVTIGAGGTLTLPGASSLTNFGTINLQGAAGNNAILNLDGAVLTNESHGTITGGGIIQNAAQVVNLSGGSILATSTVVELQFTNASTFGNAGTIGATAGATLTFGAAGVGSAIITNVGTINLAGGTLKSGNITNLANGFVGGFGTITSNLINGGLVMATNGTLTLASTPVNNATAIVANASVLNVLTDWTNGGVLSNAATGAVSGGNLTNTGTINGSGFYNSQVVNQNRMNFGGTISNSFLQTAGSFTVSSGGSTVTGSATINGGTLDLTGNQLTAGQLVIAGTGLLTNGVAGATVNGGVSNADVIAVTATTFFNGAVTNTGAMFFQGAISNNLVNSGSFDLNGGNATITGSAANTGTFNVDGDTLTVNPAWANSGTILIAGGTVAGGNLTNASGAVMNGAGNISSLLVNNGLLTVTNGTLTISVAPQQNGLVNVADGGAPGTLSVTPAWNNNGTVSIASGGAVTGGNFTNLSSGTVTNLGAINTLLVNQGNVVLGGQISNFQQISGTNVISGRGTVTNIATINGGLFDLNGGTYSNGLMILSGTGVLTSSQANATFNGGLSNAATASFSQNTYFNGIVTNLGAFIFQGAISNNLVNAGNGTVTLNNTATITKTVTLNGGTFNLNGQTYSNGLMTLGGTAVLTNGITGATFNGGLSNGATVAVTANTFFNGPVTNTGFFFLQGAVSNSFVNTANATLTLNNNATITGQLANLAGNQVNIGGNTLQLLSAPTQNGTVTIGANGALDVSTAWANGGAILVNGGFVNGGNLTNVSGATLAGFGTISNAVINSAGALITVSNGTLALVTAPVQNGGVVVNGNGVLNVIPDWSSGGTISIAAGGAMTGGNLTNTSGSGTLSGSGFIDNFVVNQGRMNWGGTISNNFLQTAGSFTLSGGATITGAATITGGALDLVGNRLTDGQLVIAGAGLLTNAIVGATVNGGISNAATVNFSADAYVNAPVTNTGFWLQRGAISNNVVNSGTMLVLSNNIAARITGSVINSGSLTFTNVFVSGLVTNTGSFSFSGAISNNLVNTASGSITLGGAGTVTGSTLVDGGTFNLNGQSFTDALMVVDGSGGILTNGAANASLGGGLSNASVVAVTANTFFKGPVTNTGTFQWQGAISNTFVNSGTTKLNGAGTITGASSITAGSFDLNGKSLASSQMIVTSAGVLTNSTAGASMSGVVTLQNSTLSGQLVTNAAALSGSGTISAPLVNAAAGVLTANSGLLTVTGALTQNGTVNVAAASTLNVQQAFGNSGSLNMQGGFLTGGNINNTAGNNISGFGTISNSVANAGLITATGGTLTMAGGALTTQTGSGINVTGSGALSVTHDWADSGTLAIAAGGVVSGGTLTNAGPQLSGSGLITSFVVNQDYMNWGGTISNNLLQTAGSFTLSGNATITGTTTINGGTLDLEGNVMTNGQLVIGNGAVLQNGGGSAAILNGNITNSGTVDFFVSAEADINGLVVNNGTWFQTGIISNNLVNNGTMEWLTWEGGGNTPLITGSISNSGSLALISVDAAQVNGSVTNTGTFALHGTIGGSFVQSAGYFVSSNATIDGTATVTGGSFDLAGNTYTGSRMIVSGTGVLTNGVAGATFNSGLSNAATVFVSQNTFFTGPVTNTGTFAFLGAVSNTLVNSGDVILNGSGTISGLLANSGSVNVNNGTLSLVVAPTQTGTITVNNGATVNAAKAWVNNGTITMLGGVVTNAAITNANFVSGYGTIDGGGVVNNGKILANAGSISGNGTLTVRLASFTNNNAATIGTASSNAVLNILQAGNILINQGTVSLSGGTIDFNGGAGTITNFNTIAGVGNVANFAIVNAGTLASFVAQAPISGLSNLIATIGVTNNGLLGANNLINGAATLSLTVSGGGSAIVNQGTVALQGGFLTVNGGAGVITNVNNGLIYGVGTQALSVANLATGKIVASNGVFSLGLQSNANAGLLSNGTAASTIQLTNAFLKNTGTIVLNGGGLLMNGVITNESSITGPGLIVSSLYNDTPGVVLATNGLLTVATNAGEVVQNLGLFAITSDGTLDVAPSWVNTNGTVSILGGGLMGGAVTNVGFVSGFGTISSQLVNMGGGTLTASGAGLLTLVAAPTQNGWVNIANTGTLNVQQAWLNSGTVDVQGGSLVGSTVTNSGTIFGSGTITPQVRNNSGGTVTVSGGTLTLTIAPSQLGSVIISNAATLNVLQAWQNGGTLNLQGGTAIGSSIANASAITGFGTITPQVQNAIGGTVTAAGGALALTVAPSQLGTFAVANGGTLNVQQAWQNSGLLSMSGGTAIGSTITNAANVNGFGTITPQLVNNVGATVTATGGTLTLTVAPVQLGNLVISNAATLNSLQAWQNSGSMIMRGGTVIGAGITNSGSLEGFGTINPQVVNDAGATLTADSGLLTLALALMQNGTVIVTNGGTLNVLTAWQNNGTIAMLGGNIAGSTVTNAGTMTGFGGVQNAVNNGLIFVTNGTLQATASFTQNGTVSVAANAQLDVTPTWLNNGTILLNGGYTSGGTMTNAASSLLVGFGTISNAVVNAGSLVATNGTLNLVNALTQSGTITVANAATFNSVPAWQNGGFLSLLGGSVVGGQLTNAGSVTGFGTFSPSVINNSGATITASGGGTLTLTAIPFQNGIVNILGTLNVASAWSNGSAGTVTINGGVLTGGTFTVDGTVGGNGTIAANMIVGSKTVTVNGGTLNLTALTTINGGAINNGALVNYGTISGDGTIGSTLSNPGYVRATNGLLYIQALSGNQATGTLEASAGGTLQANGVTPWLNNGQVILSGGTVIGGDISNNTSHIISGYGTIAPNVYNNGQLLANNAGQTLTLNGTLVNQSGGAVTVNTGNLVVDGAFVNQGTLAMANSMGTFAGTVVNSGAWITDPTTNVFQNTYTLANSGFIQSSAGDVYIFSNNATSAASFINLSTNKTQYNTLNGNFQFANTLGVTQVFATAGLDLEPAQPTATNTIQVLDRDLLSLPGYSNNFALGTLDISSFTTVRVDNAFLADEGDTNADLTAGLYLNNLDMGTDSLLIISTNVEVYFINSNSWSLANVQLQDNPNYDQTFDGIHQLVVVPEPTIVLLWLSSIATIYAARKRGAGKK
ncbi:MAG: autotransporter-associated beta strand repeat-containing protein [Verrucomicrobiia bacterium]